MMMIAQLMVLVAEVGPRILDQVVIKRMIKSKAFFLAILLLGCSSATIQTKIKDADINMVQSCKFAGSVSGTSGFGGLAASHGVMNAKKEALQQAEQLGATHIVWVNISAGMAPYVSGNAYTCN